MVHPANGALRESNGAEDDDHQLNAIQALAAILVGEIAKDDHAHGGAREGQGIDGDLDISLMFGSPVYESQTGQNDVGGEEVVGIGKEAGGSDGPDAPVEAMLVYYGDELFALAIDGRDVASVFGRIEGPGALLQMEMGARLGRPVGRGHSEAENRRCRGTPRVKRVSRCVSGCASACELQRRRREIVSSSLTRRRCCMA